MREMHSRAVQLLEINNSLPPLIGLCLMAAMPGPLVAQVGEPRTTAYELVTTSHDVRSIWSNPGGLSLISEASVIAEAHFDLPDGSDARLGQYTVGFNSRGLAFVYQRDRFLSGLTGNTFRFGISTPMRHGAIGFGITLYRGDGDNARDTDIGVRYLPGSNMDLGLVVRHIGRPVVRGIALPISVAGGATWYPSSIANLSGQISVTENQVGSNANLDYRIRVVISPPRLKASGLVSVALDNDGLRRVHIGLVWGESSIVALGTVERLPGTTRLETISLTGVASRALAQVR